ncbi:MAG: hypothetical protein ACKO23_03415 [Gemmataceae bacterium]
MIKKYLAIVFLVMVLPITFCPLESLPSQEGKDPGQRLKRKTRDTSSSDMKTKGEGQKQEPRLPQKEEKAGKSLEEDRLTPENGPPREQDDGNEVLERIEKNMRLVEENLSNNEWGEGTSQIQRDIIQDLESLLKPNDGGDQNGNQPPPATDKNKSKDQSEPNPSKGQKGKEKSEEASKGKGSSAMGKKQAGRRPPRQLRTERNNKQKNGEEKRLSNQSKPSSSGKQQSSDRSPEKQGSGSPKEGPKSAKMADLNPEIIKDIWGHLPESVRAEMDAYSNPQPFHPRYDRLIREYYKTIAETGRKKGD